MLWHDTAAAVHDVPEVSVVKLIAFIRRNPSLSVEEFHRHWREVHARKILDNDAARRYLVRYEQNHRTTDDYRRRDDMHGDFDGVAIQWFRSVEDFHAMVADPGYQAEVGPDEAYLLDVAATRFVLTDAEETILTEP